MDDFDPCDWDSPYDSASWVHITTGELMSYDEYYTNELTCAPDVLERARLMQRARSAERSQRLVAKHLIAIGDKAGFDHGNEAFAWQDLVDHVCRRLEAVKEST
jgi:hypothetical protein